MGAGRSFVHAYVIAVDGGRRRSGRMRGPDSIVKNAVSTFAAQMTTASLTAVLTLFLVRGLGPRQYGLFALTIGMSSIAVALADLGISDSTARFVAEHRGRDDGELGALVGDALKLKLVVTGVLCALFAALAPVIADLYGNPDLAWPVRGIALATFGQSTYAMVLGISTALGRAAVNVRLVAAESLLEVAASVALVLAGAGAAGAAFGRAVGFGLGAVIAAGVVLRVSGHGAGGFWHRPRRETIRLVGGYAGPVFAIDASYTIGASLSVLLVGAYLGSAASGVFQAPSKLIILIQYVGLSTAYGVAPRLSRGPDQEPNVNAMNRALRGLIGFQCLMLAPAVVWAKPITHLLLGSGYAGSAGVLAALAPYIFFSGLAPLVTTGVSYIGEARRRVPIAFATLVLVAVSGVILIPSHGVVGAAIATDIAFGFYTLAHIWLCRRLLELRIGMLAWSLACGLTAAAAMGLVLASVGTTHLTILDWLIGAAGGVAAYVGMLVFTSEVRGADIARATAEVSGFRARRKLTVRRWTRPKPAPDPEGPDTTAEPSQGEEDAIPLGPVNAALGDPPAERDGAPANDASDAGAGGRHSTLGRIIGRWAARFAARPLVVLRPRLDEERRSPAAQPPAWLANGVASRPRLDEDLPPAAQPSAWLEEGVAPRPRLDEGRRSPAAQPPAWIADGVWSRQGGEPQPAVAQREEDLGQAPEARGDAAAPLPAGAKAASEADGPASDAGAPASRAGAKASRAGAKASRAGGRASRADAKAALRAGAKASRAGAKAASRARAKAASRAGAKAVSRAGANVVYEIAWRLVDDDAGVFELRPVDMGDVEVDGSSVSEQSPPVRWGSSMAPAPTPEARHAHAELVNRLVASAWRRAGPGDGWFADRFQVPDSSSPDDARRSRARRRTPDGKP
jgi:O-antigen/teichoic acid export membrane protein